MPQIETIATHGDHFTPDVTFTYSPAGQVGGVNTWLETGDLPLLHRKKITQSLVPNLTSGRTKEAVFITIPVLKSTTTDGVTTVEKVDETRVKIYVDYAALGDESHRRTVLGIRNDLTFIPHPGEGTLADANVIVRSSVALEPIY